jgi:hypothetical protein
MKASELSKVLTPFKHLVDPKAIDPLFRTLELTANRVYGQSIYAQLDTAAAIGVSEPCFVDGTTFISVVESMPGDSDIVFKAMPNGLGWKCGNASGTLNQLPAATLDKNSNRRGKNVWKVNESFTKALGIGAIACNKNMAQANMFGVVLNNSLGVIGSSDSTTIARASFDNTGAPTFDTTLSLAATELLESAAIAEGGSIEYTDKGLMYRDATTNLLVATIDPLKYDIIEMANTYPVPGKITTGIPRDLVASFIKRAAAMAEIKQYTYVTMSGEKGRISLSFAEGASSTDEYYMVAGSKLPNLPPIKLDAMRLARALSQADDMVLDYLDKNVLVLVNKAETFRYIVAGRSE